VISIIVPIFGVEPFLDVCVLSLIHQTYTDLEIILVDDGSPDCCDRICDHYAALDPRIRVIHKKSSGPSDARNAGLKVARGEYIGFVDSDDYIAGNMFETLHKLLTETGSDIAICGHVMTSNKGKPYPYLLSHKTRVMDSEEAIKRMLQVGQYESLSGTSCTGESCLTRYASRPGIFMKTCTRCIRFWIKPRRLFTRKK
jgi:glycosyltransferase involved in cell wall biosynthesis